MSFFRYAIGKMIWNLLFLKLNYAVGDILTNYLHKDALMDQSQKNLWKIKCSGIINHFGFGYILAIC